ncbi:DedA family protein [Microbacterium paludicola]|uniref:DedA family protein n=1 Tax=Microbacterium paludicola TaxID=300019 RepID=UPI0031D25BB9
MDLIFAFFVALQDALVAAATSPWMPLVLFAVCVLDGFFPPVPSETVLVASTVVAWTNSPAMLPLILVVAIVGAWIGDNLAFAAGRRIAAASARGQASRRSSPLVRRLQREMDYRPAGIILTGRFIPVLRVAVNVAAGAAGMPWRRFVPLSLLAATGWVTVTTALALVVGTLVPLDPLAVSMIAVGIALAAGLTADRIVAWRRDPATRSETV